jgi:AsmA protein
MRKIMVVVAVVLVLLVLIVLSLPFLLDLNRYRDHYLPILQQMLHRNVEVKNVQLTLFPKLGIQLQLKTLPESSIRAGGCPVEASFATADSSGKCSG